jgi:tetratricopeptide (TPR) repeat protein
MSSLQDLLDRGDRDGARAAATKVLSGKPTDGEALSVLARLALEAGEIDAAKGHLARVGPKERQSYEVLLAEAMVLQLTDQADAARLAFAQLTGSFPTRHEAFFALGLSLLDKQDAKGAEKALGTAVKLAPKHFLYRFRHAEACAQAGRFEDAANELMQAIELKPDFTNAYTAFARMLEASGQTDRALELIAVGLQATPGDRRLVAEQARLKLNEGDVAAALAGVEKVPGGALGLAEELMRANAHDAAIEVCEHLEATGKGSAKVSLVKALALENSARTDEALEAYAKAMAQDPSDWSAANNRGLLLLEEYQEDAAKVEEARLTLEEAVKRAAGKAADPLLNLALLHARKQEWTKGIALAQQVVAHPTAGPLKAQAEKMIASMQKAAKPA